MLESNPFLVVLGVAAAMLGMVTAMLWYLQTSRAQSKWAAAALQDSVRQIEGRLTLTERQLADRVPPISESQRKELANRLEKRIREVAAADFLENIRAALKDQQAHLEDRETDLQLRDELEKRHKRTVDRLVGELADLSQRGNLNLAIGIGTAIVGVVILGYFVIVSMGQLGAGTMAFATSFIPRISLVVVIQIFAYYFLRLYSSSLMEIKYFQNELTNVEVQFLALRTAMGTGKEQPAGEILLRLAKTERNHVLKKGQSTVDIERRRMEKETLDALIQAILKDK